jgi:hypothetical protein
MPRGENLKPYHFKSKGIGLKDKSMPLCVGMPPEIDALIRALPNRSEWMRRVLTEAAQRELMQDSQ